MGKGELRQHKINLLILHVHHEKDNENCVDGVCHISENTGSSGSHN